MKCQLDPGARANNVTISRCTFTATQLSDLTDQS